MSTTTVASSDVKRRDKCRLCDGKKLELVLPIKASPIADAYVTAHQLHEKQGVYPLDLYLCRDCGHVQNLDIVNPDILFRDYIYATSTSLGLVDHFRRYADDIVARFKVAPTRLVVEIGSNDGSLLKFFKAHGLRVQGVDPARGIAELATQSGVPTEPDFFTSTLATRIQSQQGSAAIVAANNVFAHADDLTDIVQGIHTLLADDGVFVFEVSYLPDIVDKFVFDTVYHEHVSYHSIEPLTRFFDRLGMQLFDVERIGSKGGSIRGFAQRRSATSRPVTERVAALLTIEAERGFSKPDPYREYAAAIEARKQDLLAHLDRLRAKQKVIAGYGASTTVTTLSWHFELNERLAVLFDDNPRKQGRYSPGAHIPVLSSDDIYTRRPDAIVILAWQYAEPILKRHQRYLDEGGQFIVPLPALKIFGHDQSA